MGSATRPVQVCSNAKVQRTSGSLRIERRCAEREPAKGTLAATYSDGGGRFGLTHLTLIDRSLTGLGAVTRTQVEPGMSVMLCTEGSRIPWLPATVARCERQGDEYRIGLSLSPLAAA